MASPCRCFADTPINRTIFLVCNTCWYLQIATLLLDAKADLGAARPEEAELKCTDALVRCNELADKRASRAVLRVMVTPSSFWQNPHFVCALPTADDRQTYAGTSAA